MSWFNLLGTLRKKVKQLFKAPAKFFKKCYDTTYAFVDDYKMTITLVIFFLCVMTGLVYYLYVNSKKLRSLFQRYLPTFLGGVDDEGTRKRRREDFDSEEAYLEYSKSKKERKARHMEEVSKKFELFEQNTAPMTPARWATHRKDMTDWQSSTGMNWSDEGPNTKAGGTKTAEAILKDESAQVIGLQKEIAAMKATIASHNNQIKNLAKPEPKKEVPKPKGDSGKQEKKEGSKKEWKKSEKKKTPKKEESEKTSFLVRTGDKTRDAQALCAFFFKFRPIHTLNKVFEEKTFAKHHLEEITNSLPPLVFKFAEIQKSFAEKIANSDDEKIDLEAAMKELKANHRKVFSKLVEAYSKQEGTMKFSAKTTIKILLKKEPSHSPSKEVRDFYYRFYGTMENTCVAKEERWIYLGFESVSSSSSKPELKKEGLALTGTYGKCSNPNCENPVARHLVRESDPSYCFYCQHLIMVKDCKEATTTIVKDGVAHTLIDVEAFEELNKEGINPKNPPNFVQKLFTQVVPIYARNGEFCLNATKVGNFWLTVAHHEGAPLFFDREATMPLGPVVASEDELELFQPKNQPKGCKSIGVGEPVSGAKYLLCGWWPDASGKSCFFVSPTIVSSNGYGEASSTFGVCGAFYLDIERQCAVYFHVAGSTGKTKGVKPSAQLRGIISGLSASGKEAKN
jgi:hypothetical protein